MRKAMLVVTLIAASFAGGAAVNGPGLKWAKAMLIGKMRQGDAIPTLEIDGDGPPVAQSDSSPAPAPVAEARPAGPPPSDVPSNPPPPLAESILRASASAKSRPPAETPTEVATAAPAPITDPPADPAPVSDPEPPPPLSSPADAPALPGPTLLPAKEKESGWADAPGPAPATAVLPGSRPRPSQTNDAQAMTASAPSTPPMADPADWPALRKRMKAIGVTRYWVEGTPGGPVVFRCVVPVTGEESAGRQFEAEAEDEARAAESALRRVALWQATEKIKN